MYPFKMRIAVENKLESPQVVVVEPWANDYTLLPGEKLEIVAFGKTSPRGFTIVEWEGTSQVFLDDADDFTVFQGDRTLDCGHQRQWEAP